MKTAAPPARGRSSVAGQAAGEIARRLAPAAGKGRSALVIGNGATGLLAAAALREKGFAVAVTLRDPRRKIDLPAGCEIVDYAARHRAAAGRDVVVSATSSPNLTLAAADLLGANAGENAAALPRLFVDLAVPRDIDPAIADALPGAVILNVDDLRGDMNETSGGAAEAERRRRETAEAIIRDEAERLDLWRRSRSRYAAAGGAGAGAPDFPVFINLHGVPVLIAGGGRVAARRAEKLLAAGALVRIVSPRLGPETEKLLEKAARENPAGSGGGALSWTPAEYAPRHLDGVTLAVAATDSRAANAALGEEARRRGILVSVADSARECTFYFPAIVRSDFLAAGLVSTNGDHAMVKRAAARIREQMEAIDADCQSGQPR